MKRLILIAIPALLTFTGCTKDSINNPTTKNPANTSGVPAGNTATQGYVTVNCSSCKIDYGMPDQYRGYNISEVSSNLPFTYKTGYTLQANIYALDATQTITYSVFDSKGKQVFTNSLDQSTQGYWAVNVLLP